MVSALPKPLDIIFGCLVFATIVVAILSLFLDDTVRELGIAFGVTIGILFVTVVPILFAVAIFKRLFTDFRKV